MKVVLDTSVLVAGLRSDTGASRAVLRLVHGGALTVLASTALYLEYEDVLNRRDFLETAGLDAGEIRRFLAALALMARPVAIDVSWRPSSPDPDDDRIVECAVNGGADALVSHNIRDLRIIERFGIRLMTPGQLVRSLT